MKLTMVYGLLIFPVFLFPSEASASYISIGKLDTVGTARNGDVFIYAQAIYGDGAGRAFCNLNAAWDGVIPDTCRSWLAIAMLADAMQQQLKIQYVDENTCATQPKWSAASSPWTMHQAP